MNEALYRIVKNLISKGQIDGLEKKIDIFYAAGKLSDEWYGELIQLLHEKQRELEEMKTEKEN